MAVVISGLKKHNDDLKAERDTLLARLTEVAAAVQAAVASLHEKADAHEGTLGKIGHDAAKISEDLAGLGDSVRASLLTHAAKAEPEPEAPKATPITAAKRGKAV